MGVSGGWWPYLSRCSSSFFFFGGLPLFRFSGIFTSGVSLQRRDTACYTTQPRPRRPWPRPGDTDWLGGDGGPSLSPAFSPYPSSPGLGRTGSPCTSACRRSTSRGRRSHPAPEAPPASCRHLGPGTGRTDTSEPSHHGTLQFHHPLTPAIAHSAVQQKTFEILRENDEGGAH